MGDNYTTLRTDFCKWIEKQAQKAGSDIDAQELESMTQGQIVSKYANRWQEYLKTTNAASEEDFVRSTIDLENDTGYLDNLIDDYAHGLSEDDVAFQALDKNSDGIISDSERVNFFKGISSYDNDKNNVSLNDFTQAINEFENNSANDVQNNPFASATQEVEPTEQIEEQNPIEVAQDVEMTGDEDFAPINMFVSGKEAIEEQLKNVNEQLDFYNKNAVAVSQVVEANKSVYEDAKTAYNDKKEALGKLSENIVAIEGEIPVIETEISNQESALATNTKNLNELKTQLQNNELSAEDRSTLEQEIAALTAEVAKQEEAIDELYEKKQDAYERLDAAILKEYGATSELYQASRLVSASHQEYMDIKSCQTRINAQIHALEASGEVLEQRLEEV